ncbi:zinc-binding alcohol dehydrogenase family protein [Paenibacillus sp. sptzw28]|uniref:zinc-binding alcohol dehydrogenase family protein n=1 Tax=Paenibacillus sp. sptzw28 TaxID=715179 RepID=UPI001C6EE56F|nr:zinc-binding alcohol dehydrogenase family protein [Paenibacillus sp. sptzw28]QYR21515.1 zinc-binding alcohol dehydrogenase family protein [Paenibacillus sp. sptzw28]
MNSHQTMKAVGFYRTLPLSDPESLIDLELEKPLPTGQDLLVEVKAISVNPADVKVRARGNDDHETPKIIGWDAAGIVVQVGPECTLFKPGDEVYYAGSVVRPGCNSEFQLVDEQIVGRKPVSLDFSQAAAMPLTSITAWEGLHDRLGISHNEQENRGKTILIIGASGGVGSIATQLAKLAGLTVIGTSSRAESSQWAREHGADFIINHRKEFAPQLGELGFEKVDYIFCLNDTAGHWDNMAEVIAPQGKICSIVPAEHPLNLDLIFFKSVSFHWELMFTRSQFQTHDRIEQHHLLNKISELIDSGKVKTTLTQRLEPINAANLRLAHEKLLAGDMIGKLVLERF